jgi:hypothetical protein
MLKAPKLPTLSPYSEHSLKKEQYYLISGKHLCCYVVKLSFLGLCCEIGLTDRDFFGFEYPAVLIGTQPFPFMLRCRY